MWVVSKKFYRSSVHQLRCPDCGKKYAGQTGRAFCKRCNEHLQNFKYWKLISALAKHLHDSVQFTWADSGIKMWTFFNISGTNFIKKNGDGVNSQNFRKPSHLDAAVCLRKFHWILSLWKLQDLYYLPVNGHSFGPLEHKMDTLNFAKKGTFMNCWE